MCVYIYILHIYICLLYVEREGGRVREGLGLRSAASVLAVLQDAAAQGRSSSIRGLGFMGLGLRVTTVKAPTVRYGGLNH